MFHSVPQTLQIGNEVRDFLLMKELRVQSRKCEEEKKMPRKWRHFENEMSWLEILMDFLYYRLCRKTRKGDILRDSDLIARIVID